MTNIVFFTDIILQPHTTARMVDRSSDPLVSLRATEIRLYGSVGYLGLF